MDFAQGGNGSGEEETSNSQKGKKQYHRHSSEQIQRLEAFFTECPHPDEHQRQQLSRELGLEPKQIKFWFQNKRTQTKAQSDRADNNALRSENERLHCENLMIKEASQNVVCMACEGSSLGEADKQRNLEKLKMENLHLKEELERLRNYIATIAGKSINSLQMLSPGIGSYSNFPENQLSQGIGSPLNVEQSSRTLQNPIPPSMLSEVPEMEKSKILQTALSAMEELADLLQVEEPVWIKSLIDGSYLIHGDSYDKLFPKCHLKTSSGRTESSKDSGVVAVSAAQLINMFLDSDKWMNMFPTIIVKARTIGVLTTENLGGSLCMMYEKMHILSPLVAPREFFFIRYCRQINPSTWIMVDVSYDFMTELQDAAPTRSWKLPSGCMIQDLSNGKSMVTWIEHVQVDDKSLTHRLYRDLVSGGQGYGAKRWITTLQWMCERYAFSMGLTTIPRHEREGVINSAESRRNIVKISHRMLKYFFDTLSMSNKVDFPHLKELNNSGVRMSLHNSNDPGQPNGLVVSAATSLWLPLSPEDLFNFFQNEEKRPQWDVLADGNPVNEIAHISTGINPGNCISIIQPFIPKENTMLILQESCINSLGGIIVYGPVGLHSITEALSSKDGGKVPILPSGYIISSNGHYGKGAGPSTSSGTSKSRGSLLTVAYQVLVGLNTPSKQLDMESIANIHYLIGSTVEKIKMALGCPESDIERT